MFADLMASFEKTPFRYVDLLLNADAIYNKKYIRNVLKSNPNINKAILCSYLKDDLTVLNHYQCLETRTARLVSREQCGQMGAKYFTTSLNHVIESHSFNSCLNKKLSIDEDGLIKNCPSLKQHFGAAAETSLIEVIEKSGFKDLWSVGKDNIEICKDCEFRHICTDCRAYTQNSGSNFSKPIKCGYNPYSNTWEDWSLNPLAR